MKKIVLIIDDEVELCHLMQKYLVKRNFEVHYTITLIEGIQKIEQLNPDILFLDYNLPDGFGWDYVPALIKKYPHLRINLMSAFSAVKPEVSNHVDLNVLTKPITLRQIDQYVGDKIIG